MGRRRSSDGHRNPSLLGFFRSCLCGAGRLSLAGSGSQKGRLMQRPPAEVGNNIEEDQNHACAEAPLPANSYFTAGVVFLARPACWKVCGRKHMCTHGGMANVQCPAGASAVQSIPPCPASCRRLAEFPAARKHLRQQRVRILPQVIR